MRTIFLVVLGVTLGCLDPDPSSTPAPDAQAEEKIPACKELGCTGPLLCSSTSACTCDGRACIP